MTRNGPPAFLALARQVDHLFIRTTLPFTEAQDGLVVLLFHTLHAKAEALEQPYVDARYALTVDKFRATLTHFLKAGYTPISPDALLDSNIPAQKRLLVTFDDGYFNNTLALPVLEALDVPAVFFIATDYIQTGRGFWWDTLIRKRTAQDLPLTQTRAELQRLSEYGHEHVAAHMDATFGAEASTPVGDVDRPMTPAELRTFAAHPLVHLGNHTHNHGSLTAYDADGVRRQIELAQDALHHMTGTRPRCIAYPNGKHDAAVLEAVAQTDMALGFTSRPHKTRGPVPATQRLALGRFVVSEANPLGPTCSRIRADVSLLRSYSRWKKRRRQGTMSAVTS